MILNGAEEIPVAEGDTVSDWEVWTVAVDVSNPITVLISTDEIAMAKEHELEQP